MWSRVRRSNIIRSQIILFYASVIDRYVCNVYIPSLVNDIFLSYCDTACIVDVLYLLFIFLNLFLYNMRTHRLILRSSQPLLKSRNSGVVLGVCMLHYYCGSHNTSITQQIGKSLVRILRDRREIQYVVLNSINTMAHERPSIFKPFLSEFFIKASDPIFNR